MYLYQDIISVVGVQENVYTSVLFVTFFHSQQTFIFSTLCLINNIIIIIEFVEFLKRLGHFVPFFLIIVVFIWVTRSHFVNSKDKGLYFVPWILTILYSYVPLSITLLKYR